MAGTGTVSGYDSEVAQYMARQKRMADQDRGGLDQEDADAYKKLMGKFGNGGVLAPDSAKGLGGGGTQVSSKIGLDAPLAPAAASPAAASPAAASPAAASPAAASPASPEPANAEPPKTPEPPAPPAPKKKKKKNCLQKTFEVIGKIAQVVVPAVVGFFTGGPVGAVMGAVQGVSSLAQKQPA